MSTLTLRSSDGHEFVIDRELIMQKSSLIRHNLEDTDAGTSVPLELPAVSARVLRKIVAFLVHNEMPAAVTAPTESVDQNALYELILATFHLDLVELRDLACKHVADLMKDKTVEEIRTLFNIENDYRSPEEEAQVRHETEWCRE